MALTLEEERARREAALLEFEGLLSLFRQFIHGAPDDVVVTDNGPIRTMAAVAAYPDAHDAEVTELLTQLTTAMDNLPETEEPPAG